MGCENNLKFSFEESLAKIIFQMVEQYRKTADEVSLLDVKILSHNYKSVIGRLVSRRRKHCDAFKKLMNFLTSVFFVAANGV